MKVVRKSLFRCLAALLAVISPCVSVASDVRPMQFDKITLPYEANVVSAVCKDSLGMMWFATRRGLFSYDGYSVSRLVGGNYQAAVVMADGTLCMGGDFGLRWMDLRTEQYVTPYGDVPETGEVRSLLCHGDVLYVGTRSNGLFCLDLKRRIWQRYTLPDGRKDIIFSFAPANGCIFIAHYGGLAFIDPDGNMHDAGIADNVYALWHDAARNRLWIGTEHQLLCRNMADGTTEIVASGSTFNQIVPSPSGELLLSSDFGLKILNPATGGIQTIAHDASAPQNGLPSNTIHQIFCDGNTIWIATDRGVALTRQDDTFEVTGLPSISGSTDGNVFSKIFIASNGDRWMGGDNGILHLSRGATKWFKVGNGLKKSIVRNIYEDRSHDIWIATDASIARYNPLRDNFDYFTLSDANGRNANWAYDIYEDERGRMWIATYMGGLYVVDRKALLSSGGAFVMADSPFADSDSIVNTIYKFLHDGNGILWAYTSKGLASIDTRTDEVSLKQPMFLENMILADGVIWIDVQGELLKYDTRRDRLEKTGFVVENGMIHSFVQQADRVWMSTSQGLFYIAMADGSIHPHSRPDYCFTAGVYVPSDSTILWGGEDFVCRQFMHDGASDIRPPKVFLSAVRVGGVPVQGCVCRYETDIALDGGEDIALDLATYVYDRANSELFWYRIGSGGEWHALADGSNRITLSHLSGGRYEIFLSADAEHSADSITGYVLTVPYPWYLRWWAWLAYAVVVASVVCYATNYYKRREKMLFEQRERERILALTQEKMDFFVNMSHELKTPLSLIVAPLGKLIAETTNAKLRDSLKSIQNNATRLNALIHSILDAKQLEAEGENQILTSRIDLCSLIAGCVGEFAPSAKERGIDLSFRPSEASLLMAVDVVKVQTVMRNILSNAMKFVPDGSGRIVVAVERTASEVLVTIHDNGPGVSDGDLPKLFNRYFVGQNSRDGSGIGLSVVKKYVELHGGSVVAQNDNGLRVTFSLPLDASANAVAEPTASAIDDSAEKPLILIVDDNREILEFLTTALESSYRCTTAQSGEDALAAIGRCTPDVIITDQMMPGIDGTELCHRIRHEHATELVPIIMLTAKDDSSTELKSIRSGADVFMPKPFDLRKLQLHIVQLLSRRKAIEQSTRIERMQAVGEEVQALSNDEELMARVISLINSNMQSEDFNVAKLCDLLCIDQKQLYRKLKHLTGETPVGFIRKQRMKRAAALLSQDRFSVSEVMYQVGFSSASYFIKSFVKEFGMTPKEFVSANASPS
ncbi:MAG: response regulator [Bacteroidales bacterium]|nr:response regulator [Bacteroidales bacterium]